MKKTTPKKKTSAKAPEKVKKKPVKKAVAEPVAQVRQPQGRLIGADEPAPARVENADGKAKCVIVCDHASNYVPKSLGSLGLSKADLQKHIAWDPGSEDIGRRLSQGLDAPLIAASYSRLVVDLNRGHDNPECIRPESDHIRIPGNEGLTDVQKAHRLDTFFWPYHRVVDTQLQKFLDRGIAPALLSMHSFTPEMDGIKRPWHIGVLWNEEEDIALRLVENLRRDNPDLRIGENEPYSLKSVNYTKNTISTHAETRGLPYVIVEFRQDLVDTKQKAYKWADIFLKSLKPLLDDPGFYHLRAERRK